MTGFEFSQWSPILELTNTRDDLTPGPEIDTSLRYIAFQISKPDEIWVTVGGEG